MNTCPQPDPSENTVSRLQPVVASVVIPTYNSANHIAGAIDSVLKQTFSEYEVIVVNDGSPDTPQLELALAPYLGRIHYIKQENRGPSGARNTGILEARGKYVAFLDSDDFWLPDHLANQIGILEPDPHLGLVYADALLTVNEVPVRTFFGTDRQRRPVTFEALVTGECTVMTSATVALRQALVQAGLFDDQFRHCEDFDLWARVVHCGYGIDYTSRVQIVHRCGDGLSSNLESMKRSLVAVYEKMASQLLLSESQKRLIVARRDRAQADLHLELCKKFMRAGAHNDARVAAEAARSTLDYWKVHTLVFGLRVAPRTFAAIYRMYASALDRRRRARLARLRDQLGSGSETARVSPPTARVILATRGSRQRPD